MNARDELITERLILRRWRPGDEAPMAAINRDPEVARYLNRPVDERSIEVFYGLMEDHWARHGFGPYAVQRRDEGDFIGFVGVAYPAFLAAVADRPELGWRLARAAWGSGYATEAARVVRDEAFGRLGLAELISIIHPDNARSRRIAEKLAMVVEKQVHNPVIGIDTDVWRATAP